MLVNSILQLQQVIEGDLAETEVLDNFTKFTEGLVSNSPSKQHEVLRNNKKQTIEDRDRLFLVTSKIQKDHNKREKDSADLKIKIEENKQQKNNLKTQIDLFNDSIKSISKELNSIKNQLMMHYHSLLKEGRDTRTEGLVWIVKAIWNLGSSVILSFIPNYLDSQSIDYLFITAHKDNSIAILKTQIESLKLHLKNIMKGCNIINFKKQFSAGDKHQKKITKNKIVKTTVSSTFKTDLIVKFK